MHQTDYKANVIPSLVDSLRVRHEFLPHVRVCGGGYNITALKLLRQPTHLANPFFPQHNVLLTYYKQLTFFNIVPTNCLIEAFPSTVLYI